MSTTTATQVNPDHNSQVALETYLVLQHEHESLCQHLDELRPFGSPKSQATTASSPSESPMQIGLSAHSPFSSGQTSPRSPPTGYHSRSHRRSSLPVGPRETMSGSALETVLEVTKTELEAEEAKLFDVNEGIKRALTELLNCETVRCDRTFRTWVQCRLMATEKELRSGRRRRSNPEMATEN